ncbi:hypothetical protein ACXWRS_09600, partial [Streptococcus pyogenes]
MRDTRFLPLVTPIFSLCSCSRSFPLPFLLPPFFSLFSPPPPSFPSLPSSFPPLSSPFFLLPPSLFLLFSPSFPSSFLPLPLLPFPFLPFPSL